MAGHEGSGYVRAVGKDVTKVALGDPVLLSFDYCKSCHMCEGDQPGFCEEFDDRNFVGSDSHFATEKGEKTWGQFFGQSSFANWSVVKAASVLNAKDLVRNEEELKLFAPLGCGIQTGSGAIVNAAKAGPEDRVLVMGLGGVGLSAIMAAKIAGCKTIIGMDRVAGRLELARELGATHVVNTAGFEGGMEGVVKEVRKIADGVGVTVAIDTTGELCTIPSWLFFSFLFISFNPLSLLLRGYGASETPSRGNWLTWVGWTGAPPVLDHCMQMIARRGKMIIIGVAPPDYEFKVGSLTAFMSASLPRFAHEKPLAKPLPTNHTCKGKLTFPVTLNRADAS